MIFVVTTDGQMDRQTDYFTPAHARGIINITQASHRDTYHTPTNTEPPTHLLSQDLTNQCGPPQDLQDFEVESNYVRAREEWF